jgi:hypothetical protein
VLQERSFDSLKRESLHFPNLSSLMKISLGLILFTIISTVLVYAETSENTFVQIIENAYVKDSSQHFDNSLFSSSPGAIITVVNNDVVSHKFVIKPREIFIKELRLGKCKDSRFKLSKLLSCNTNF